MLYLYQHPSTEEIREVWQNMNDVHELIVDGIKWNRLWTKPQAMIDSKFSPWDKSKFVEKTSRPGKMSDLYDRSAELSEKRKQESGLGFDPLSKAAKEKWSKERGGKKWIDPKAAKDKVIEIG